MTHISMSPIELYADLYDRETYGDKPRRRVSLRSKIKIHGTGGAVRIETDGSVHAQSKTLELTPEDDLNGFAASVQRQADLWSKMAGDETITVYGEWAGPRIAKGTAIQRTDRIRFFIFHVGIGQMDDPRREGAVIPRWIITDPAAIELALPADLDRDEVRVIPYNHVPYEFNFASEDQLEHMLSELNAQVDALVLKDPYVKDAFNIEGPGEGYVLVPHSTAVGQVSGHQFSQLAFKAKIDKFRVQKQKAPAAPREPLPASALELIDRFVTEPRLDQAIEEVASGNLDKRDTAAIIKWMITDVEKEAQPEITALDVDFVALRTEITNATRTKFFARMEA